MPSAAAEHVFYLLLNNFPKHQTLFTGRLHLFIILCSYSYMVSIIICCSVIIDKRPFERIILKNGRRI